jgi:LPXTG-site transpeptidase (sortase) family protein
MLLAGLALAVPWYRPGFGAEMSRWGHSIDRWTTSAGTAIGHWISPPAPAPVVVQDPPILTSEPAAPASHTSALKAMGVPQFLSVPLLQVNSPVTPISGNSGELLPPSNPQVIGWWEQGPKPGSSQGTAVLTGHTVHYGGGAFDHLSFLHVGDHFSIQTDHGTIRYVIVHLHKYETGALARDSSSLFQLSGPPRVLLVTCSGWNGHIYLENTVVTGVPVT